jgi:uncharacterized repeat protein (TIGR02543 family)
VAKSPDQATYDYNTNVELTATLATGYHFVNWSGDVSGTDNSITVKMDGDKNITANFAINTYTITITAENGRVEKNPDQAAYEYNTKVELTATPATGYHFVEWTGDACGKANPLTVMMDKDKTITANFEINTFTLTITAVNGTVAKNPDQTVYEYNTKVELTATAAAGYHFVEWTGDASGKASPLTITMDKDKTITANFALSTFTIKASAGPKGSISPSGAVSVAYGASQTFTIAPDTGYHIADVLVDGLSVGTVTSYTFTNVTADHTIEASFAITAYTIEASAGAGGTIAPSGLVSVNNGDNITFKISPSEGYHIADVIVDGTSVGAVKTYTFYNVTSNHSISATFAVNTFIIFASAEKGGTITPAGKVTVNYGGSQTFAIVPNNGYHIASVRVDRKSVGALSSYTFTNVIANHKIEARFASDFVRADVVIHPDTLNLKSESDENTITAYIKLPRRHHEAKIDVATVKLDVLGTMVPALMTRTSEDDHYDYRSPGRIVKFSRQAVISALKGQTGNIIMTVSGQLKDGTRFSGSDTVKVIDQGKKKGGHN